VRRLPGLPLKPVTHRGVVYFALVDALLAGRRLPEPWRALYRTIPYARGHAVQLHRSGPYAGPQLDQAGGPEAHLCAWCPAAWRREKSAAGGKLNR